MTDTELIDALGGTNATARFCQVKPPSVTEWRSRGIPRDRKILMATQVEQRLGLPRWRLLPDEWHRIWPELIGTEGAPGVPTSEPAAQGAA